MFNYCPSCASKNIRFENGRFFYCPDCGFKYYHNVAAATACLIDSGSSILFLVRGREPATGKLDLPGGFVDPNEGAIEGLIRECNEELSWTPRASEISLFASFPNVYTYKNIDYNTCDLFFSIRAPDLLEKNLELEKEEIKSARFIEYAQIDLNDLAFPSAKRAVEAYLKTKHPVLK
ncbi:MAG: NUDIX domain-containing protein [Spirochaetaceae bacterium]|jgi:ADP-ribose pyrophosphatase YjhB (NUDIX family)|nr:NUDIX domain-containing protein [Spirochaetaceae bacterium]